MIDNICFHNKAGSTQLLYTNVKTTVKKTMNPDLNVIIENGEELKCINIHAYKQRTRLKFYVRLLNEFRQHEFSDL